MQDRADSLISQLRQDFERQAAQLRGVAAAATEEVAATRYDLSFTAGNVGSESGSQQAGGWVGGGRQTTEHF